LGIKFPIVHDHCDAETVLRKLANQFKAIALTGPRQSGKSTLARTAFPEKKYVSLENPDIRESELPIDFIARSFKKAWCRRTAQSMAC
jgi:predicted AAA+ superfamily ATPase